MSASFISPLRHLVVPGRGLRGVPLVAPWWRSLVGSALSVKAVSWRLRASARSFSGAVVIVQFPTFATAHQFAAAWAGWCGLALAVRPCPGGFAVSVPVAVPASAQLPLPAVTAPAPGTVWVH